MVSKAFWMQRVDQVASMSKTSMSQSMPASPGSHQLPTEPSLSSSQWNSSQQCSSPLVRQLPQSAHVSNAFCTAIAIPNNPLTVAGQLVVVLFVLVNKLSFAGSCLSSIFYVAATILVAQDAHVGSKLTAAAFVIGPLWFGVVLAGCAVSICKQLCLSGSHIVQQFLELNNTSL